VKKSGNKQDELEVKAFAKNYLSTISFFLRDTRLSSNISHCGDNYFAASLKTRQRKMMQTRYKKMGPPRVVQGCQIVLATTYQNGGKYQMTTKYTKWREN
jgi:hypothetical protein